MNLEELVTNLEGKSVNQLGNYLVEAQQAESMAKKDLYVIRQRVANLGTDAEVEEETIVGEAKQKVRDLIAYVDAIKVKLGGSPSNPVTDTTISTSPAGSGTSIMTTLTPDAAAAAGNGVGTILAPDTSSAESVPEDAGTPDVNVDEDTPEKAAE